MTENTKLGSLLARLRGERGFTQGALAKASGISRTQIAYLETGARGKGDITLRAATGLAKAFGFSVEKFMSMVEEEQPADVAEPRRPGRPRKPESDGDTAAPAPEKASKPAAGTGKATESAGPTKRRGKSRSKRAT